MLTTNDVRVGDRIYFTEKPFDEGQHYLIERIDDGMAYGMWVTLDGKKHPMADAILWSVIDQWGPYVRRSGAGYPQTASDWDDLLRRKTHEALASVFTDD